MKKGFTFLEIMFVMVIMAILAGMAVNMFNDSQKTRKKEYVRNDLKRLISQENRLFTISYKYEIIESPLCSDSGEVITDNGVKFFVEEGNCIQVLEEHCEDGTSGFIAKVWYGDDYEYEHEFHSCTSRDIEDITD